MQKSNQFRPRVSEYPPTVLFLNEDNPSILELKRSLEKRCQVYQTDIYDNLLAVARQNDVELIVLNAETLGEDDCEIFQQLQNKCEFGNIPIVILTSSKLDVEKINKLKRKCPIYCLPINQPLTEASLWQIIEWKHYLAHRYM